MQAAILQKMEELERMKQDTRAKILSEALALFNDHGYDGVTLQQIAEAAGVSKGNLTYYFGRKESVAETLLNQQPVPALRADSCGELVRAMTALQKTLSASRFCFLYQTASGPLAAQFGKRQRETYRAVVPPLRERLDALQQQGQLRREDYPGEYQCVANELYLSALYWGQFQTLSRPAGSPASYRQQVRSLLRPLLTDAGRKALDELPGCATA